MTTFLRIDPDMFIVNSDCERLRGKGMGVFNTMTKNQARCRSWALLVTRRIEAGGVENTQLETFVPSSATQRESVGGSRARHQPAT